MGIWDSGQMWLKAKAFVDKANALGHADPDFGLWSALGLELLARAALTNVHPALNADAREDHNLLYAFGFPLVEKPRSLPAHSVYLRLEKVIPGFLKPHRVLCDRMALLRNSELHTSELAFSPPDTASWLPQFYAVCKILCDSLGKSLTDLLGPGEAAAAHTMILAFSNAKQTTVKDKVAAHAKVFLLKSPEERAKLSLTAEIQTELLRFNSVKRTCPACGSLGVLRGEQIKEFDPVYEDGELLVDEEYLATDFKCPACGLHLPTIDEIGFAGLELHFILHTSTELHERFQAEYEDDYENM